MGADFNWNWQASLQSSIGTWNTDRPGVNVVTDTQDSIIAFIPKFDSIHTYVSFGKMGGSSYFYTDSTGTFIHTSMPATWTNGSNSWRISNGSHSGWTGVGTSFVNNDVNNATPVTGSTGDLLCIEFAKGVQQGVWGYNTTTGGTYTDALPGVTRPCDGFLQIACTVEDIFAGIGDDFISVGQAILRGLGALFVPNGMQLSTDWTGFYSTLTTKLGFLTWPFSFVGNMFTAITTPTTTCCVIGAGTFMGATFPGLDLAFASTHLPSLWNFATAAIRGLTVLMLFFMLRSKFMEITSK